MALRDVLVKIISSSKAFGAEFAIISVGSGEVYVLYMLIYSPSFFKFFPA